MGVPKTMHFLFRHCPQAIEEPVDLGQRFPNAIIFVDAFPFFWRLWTSLFGGVNDANARRVQEASNFFGSILDEWLNVYNFTVVIVIDPATSSQLKQPEQQRRIATRGRGQRKVANLIRQLNANTMSARDRTDIRRRARSQGFGNALDEYLEKRKRQLRNMGVICIRAFYAAIQQRIDAGLEITAVQVPDHIEAEMYCCRLADREYTRQSRIPLSRRSKVLVYTPDTDILAYRSQGAPARGEGWTWVSNVMPNRSNPNDDNYDWGQWWADPAADTCGIWRAIRPNVVRRALRLSVPQMTDMFILAHNTIRQSDLKGMSLEKAYQLIRTYRNLEGVNRNMPAPISRPSNQPTWQWIMQNRARLRRFWTDQPVP